MSLLYCGSIEAASRLNVVTSLCHVSVNLLFILKIIVKAFVTKIHNHLINDNVDNCETALIRMYNDIVTTIGRCNGVMLVLLDLSAASDTIDPDYLFCILEKNVRICGNALKLIKSYFLIVLNVFKLIMFYQILLEYLWCFSWLCFRTLKILFVLIANERYFEVS